MQIEEEFEEFEGLRLTVSTSDIDRQILLESNHEARELEKEVSLLADCFKELAILLGNQGEELLKAEQNTKQIECNTKEAADVLEKAEESVRPKNWIFRGALAFTGVTAGGVGLFFLNPIAGIAAAGVGLAGLVGLAGVAVKQRRG